jgi:GntR family transcriptional regulator / MocR family aminotransferase
MARTLPNTFLLSLVQLDRTAATPLYRQMYQGLRQAILNRQLEPGVCLPSSRDLASMLEVSRNTVLNAFDLLIAEGYLEPREGSGTYVSARLFGDTKAATTPAVGKRALSQRGERYRRIAAFGSGDALQARFNPDAAFLMGMPDLEAFPYRLWARLTAQHARALSRRHFSGQNSAGYRPLQEAVTAYLTTARGVRCTPEQVFITAGAQEAIHLVVNALLDPGDEIWFEDPGYMLASGAIYASGAKTVYVPVDEEGIDVDAGIRLSPGARMAYVTPSHQFPTGVTMTLTRRFKLLDWAQSADAWIIEDDYDSEYRYHSPPLASLQGLDEQQRVLYVGTFSKVLFPSLRLGYLVAPPDLIDVFRAARMMMNMHPPILSQIVVAEFMIEGHFTRHIRRMRQRYAEKHDLLLEAARQYLGDRLRFEAVDAGLHVAGWLPPGSDDVKAMQRARAHDVSVLPVSRLSGNAAPRQGLVLGFGGVPLAQIRAGIQRLAQALEG